MRKRLNLLFAVIVFALIMVVDVHPTYATEVSTEAADPVYSVIVHFNSNGGTGSMSDLSVTSNQPAELPANAFTKTGYQFAGWNTKKDGSGTTYADKADVTELATADSNEITLYAQWKLTQPKIKKATSTTPSYIKVTFAKCQSVSGYEIQYSTGKKFKEAKTETVKAAKTATSAQLYRVTPNKTYYIRMRSYKTSKGVTQYSDWSKVVSTKVKNGKTIANTSCDVAIEADVKLNGSGTGYHAKLVMGNPYSAVSFGMQYDKYAEAPYTGKNMALIENISSNSAGGQSYSRPGNKVLKLNKTYHLMMTSDGKGHVDVYVDYKKIGSCYQPDIANTANGIQFVRIEASGRLNGDKVDAEFSNIKYTINGKKKSENLRVLGDDLKWSKIQENKGLKYKYNKNTNVINLYGTIKGLNGDWDSDYESASYILQFGY